MVPELFYESKIEGKIKMAKPDQLRFRHFFYVCLLENFEPLSKSWRRAA